MSTSPKPREEDLPQLAGGAVERALAARQSVTELSLEEAAQVGGAVAVRAALLQVPTMQIKPGDWVGPLLAPVGQQFQTPVVNAGGLRSF